MKVTLATIIENAEAIKNLQTLKMPIKVSYRLKRLVDRIQPILTSFDDKRNELIKEYGELTETGGYQVKNENITTFVEKIKELSSVEEDIEFDPISIAELGDITISPNELVDFIFIA